MPATIVFSHPTGFPAGTYESLFCFWRAAGHRVLAIGRIGHDPLYPVTSNWPRLRDQLVDFVQAQAPGERVHLVGHSLGGFLSLMAACRAPALARSLVLIEAPVITGWRAHSLHMAKLARLMPRITPARVSVRRRRHWADTEEAWRHFAAKKAFARWQPQVLRDYVACGTEPDPDSARPGGVRLSFQREVETRIYNTLPHHLGTLLHRHPPHCPVAFIGGTQSAELRHVGLTATRALTHGRITLLEGSHLVPMERPAETAAAVLRALVGSTEEAQGTGASPA